MNHEHNVIFVGGPSSGKSNYIFRTWIAIEREVGQLVKHGLPSDLDYLHSGSVSLLDGKFAPHTSLEVRQTCEIPIRFRSAPESAGMLTIPDASGEVWLDLYRKREWPVAWDALVTTTCGFLLMLRAESPHNVKALDWLTCERLYGRGIDPQSTDTPTQVLLVDWLQIIRTIVTRRVGRSYIPRLGVVVSAWDDVPLDRQHGLPQDYLEAEFPLLSQFLRAGDHGFDATVFGLSIVGGDLTNDPDFRKQFLEQHPDPGRLGYVVTQTASGQQRVGDVLVPIYWALGK